MGKSAYSIRRCGRGIVHKQAMGGMSTNKPSEFIYGRPIPSYLFYLSGDAG